MDPITLNNGIEMPALGFGVFQTPPEETRAAVESALVAGYRHIDTAAAYGNERGVGQAVHDSGLARSDVFLGTKILDQRLRLRKNAARLREERPQARGRPDRPAHPAPGTPIGLRRHPAEDPAIGAIARAHGKTSAQVMLHWHLQQGRSVIPKSTQPQRIAENIDVFDFELTSDELAAIDALDTGKRGGPEPEAITLDAFGRDIPED